MISNNKTSLWYVTNLPRLSSLCGVLYFWRKQQKQNHKKRRRKENTGQLSKHTYDQYIYWVHLGHSQVRQSVKYRSLHRVHFWFEAKISSGYVWKAKQKKVVKLVYPQLEGKQYFYKDLMDSFPASEEEFILKCSIWEFKWPQLSHQNKR